MHYNISAKLAPEAFSNTAYTSNNFHRRRHHLSTQNEQCM